jgi:hypothetical protein
MEDARTCVSAGGKGEEIARRNIYEKTDVKTDVFLVLRS